MIVVVREEFTAERVSLVNRQFYDSIADLYDGMDPKCVFFGYLKEVDKVLTGWH